MAPLPAAPEALPPYLLSRHVGELISTFFKYENALENQSIIRSISNSVDEQTYKKIMQVLKHAADEVQQLSDKSSGTIPFFFCGAVDQLNFRQVPKEDI